MILGKIVGNVKCLQQKDEKLKGNSKLLIVQPINIKRRIYWRLYSGCGYCELE